MTSDFLVVGYRPQFFVVWVLAILSMTGCDTSSYALDVRNECDSTVTVYTAESTEVDGHDANIVRSWAALLRQWGVDVLPGDRATFALYEGAPGYVVVYGSGDASAVVEWLNFSDGIKDVTLQLRGLDGECVLVH